MPHRMDFGGSLFYFRRSRAYYQAGYRTIVSFSQLLRFSPSILHLACRSISPVSLCNLALVLTLLLTGCTSSSDEASPTATFSDDLNRPVAISRPVERLVTLAPNLTEIVFAAGAGHKLVGVTTADDYPPAVDTIGRFSALPVDFEAITSLQPDLVLATDQVNTPRDAETFAALDMPVYFFSFSTVDDVLANIRTTGELLGTAMIADSTADSLSSSLDALHARTEAVAQRPRVLFLIGDETLYAFGAQSYMHTLIQRAGGESVTADLEAQAPTLSEEYVLTQQPDVIIGAFGAEYDPGRLLELHPSWDVVPAIQNNRVYSLNPNVLLRPGPRLVEGAWQMAHRLHPTRVPSSAIPSVRLNAEATP
jgi:ABC-type Fe3+-hydroxamate transport system substrate-binding protein